MAKPHDKIWNHVFTVVTVGSVVGGSIGLFIGLPSGGNWLNVALNVFVGLIVGNSIAFACWAADRMAERWILPKIAEELRALKNLLRALSWLFGGTTGCLFGFVVSGVILRFGFGASLWMGSRVWILFAINGVIAVFVSALFHAYSALRTKVEESYEKLKDKEVLEKELETARRIQLSLLPRCAPAIQGLDICAESIPAREVGGDFYDFFPLHSGKLAIVVGDVSGKGTSAAFYMAEIKGMLLMATELSESPREILSVINEKLDTHLAPRVFITMILAIYDPTSKSLEVCRAGHEPLLWYRRQEGKIETIAPCGLGLGLSRGEDFRQHLKEAHVTLDKGDVLLLFTDGVTEARNGSEDEFGVQRLAAIAAENASNDANSIHNAVAAAVRDFLRGAEPSDDLTLVVAKAMR